MNRAIRWLDLWGEPILAACLAYLAVSALNS